MCVCIIYIATDNVNGYSYCVRLIIIFIIINYNFIGFKHYFFCHSLS